MANNWSWVHVANLRGPVGPQGPAGPITKNTVTTGTDISTLRTPGRYVVNTTTIAQSLVNAPAAVPAFIDVEATSGNVLTQTWRNMYGSDGFFIRTTSALTPSPYPWTPWLDVLNPVQKIVPIASGTDIDTMRTAGKFSVTSNTIGGTLVNAPSTQPAIVTIEVGSTGLVSQFWRELYASGGGTAYHRTTSSIGTTPYPFGSWKDLAAAPATPTTSEVGLTNLVLVQDATRRRGGVKKTSGKGAVAFRFDHGLANYVNLLLPLLQARNFKHSQALNSRAWELSENTGVTQADVNTLVTSGILEIWNHGALNHSDADTLAKLNDSIVTGLAELRSQLPAAQIDGWVVPGVTGTNYMGFNGGITPDKLYSTDAGRIILGSHAFTTGGIAGTHQRVLDGVTRQGQHQYTLDERTVAQAKAEVDAAVTNKTGLQFMLHPSVVNTTDRMSVAMFTEILDYVATKQTAGDLVVLSPYELMAADSR